jgi:dienelactone hydrolase
MTRRAVLAAVLAALLAGACAPATPRKAPVALGSDDTGRLRFSTVGTIERVDASRLARADNSVGLTGELRVPDGSGPFPTVVLMHGCGGLGNAEGGWVAPLAAAGYATFVVDSFTGRGLREVCTSSRALLSVQRLPDAYGALRLLATHPRVDRRRIALMGFSHGGSVTLFSATAWATEEYGREAAAAFAAFLPFYPGCNSDFPERRAVSAPLRVHIGELDDWTPAAPCRELVALLKAGGFDADITVYPDAHHSFDNVGRRVTWLPRVDSAAGCPIRSASILGPVLNGAEILGCLHKGATLGWSPAATEQARRNVVAQLATLLRRAPP